MHAVLAKVDASTRDIAASHAARRWLACGINIGSAAGKLGDHSRSGTGASRRTVALNSSRVGGDRHAPHPAPPSFRRRPGRADCCPGGIRRRARFAKVMPSAGSGPDVVPQHLVPVHAVVTGGMPGWRITLIAAVAALLAATVLLDRAWAARRKAITEPPEPCTLLDGPGEEVVRQHHTVRGLPCGDLHQVASLT